MNDRPTRLCRLRTSIAATPAMFADRMGLPLQVYEDLEAGKSAVRPLHMRAAEMAAILCAREAGTVDKLPADLQSILGWREAE